MPLFMQISESFKRSYSGEFTFYNLPPSFAAALVAEVEDRAKILDPESQAGFLKSALREFEPKAIFKNIILKDGLKIFQRRLSSVSRIVGGYVTSTIIPSTFHTQQSLQNPLPDLRFNKIGSWEEIELVNGIRYTYSFYRPASSEGGSTINEMGIQVFDGNQSALLNRVWAPNAGLPYIFPSNEDTIANFNLEVTIN